MPHALRRQKHLKDPTVDFLFEYYSFRPSHLQKWSPGFGVILKGGDTNDFPGSEYFEPVEDGVRLSLKNTTDRFEHGTRWILSLLESTSARLPQYGCFGLHEWAMVYKVDELRHNQLPLRVSQKELNDVVETGPVNCSHYDAFRFFTPDARPLNSRQMDRNDMMSCEQPGCLHANMDVYRWAFKRYPWIGSDLIMDAFELALDIRHLDMAASPYDLAESGIDPVKIETESGRQQYIRHQKEFAARAAVLRDQLIVEYTNLLSGLDSLHDSFANSGVNS